jgi:hypothetical protein
MMEARVQVRCSGEPRRRLEVIAQSRGMTLTVCAGFLLAEAIEEHYTRIRRNEERRKYEKIAQLSMDERK